MKITRRAGTHQNFLDSAREFGRQRSPDLGHVKLERNGDSAMDHARRKPARMRIIMPGAPMADWNLGNERADNSPRAGFNVGWTYGSGAFALK